MFQYRPVFVTIVKLSAAMSIFIASLFNLLLTGFLSFLILRFLYRRLRPKWDELNAWIAEGNSLISEVVSRGSYFFLICLFLLLAL
ncbi:MAG: hypothetical protein CR993_01860 [Rhodobacterales bacterium]|nr:MAG: hypothetical protein CR993_01860 [Rhodobacterales bacterium]